MTFTIPNKAFGKERARTFYNQKLRKMQSITPEKTTSYENLVRYCFTQAGGKKTVRPVKVTIKAYMPIPSTMPKKVRLQALAGKVVPTCKPDNDNAEKAIYDALNGFAYKDDTQIAENHTYKFYDEDPRTEVTIEEIDCDYYRENGKWVDNET